METTTIPAHSEWLDCPVDWFGVYAWRILSYLGSKKSLALWTDEALTLHESGVQGVALEDGS